MNDHALRVGLVSPSERRANLRNSFIRTGLLVAVLIYLTSLVGFALRLPQSGIGFVWPPNAVLLAALLLLPTTSWPLAVGAALAGHVGAHTQDGLPIVGQLLTFVGNASQALLGAWLLRRFAWPEHSQDSRSPRPEPRLDDLRSVGLFVVATVAAPVLASFVPAIGYLQLGWAQDFWTGYRGRVFANVITTLTLAPAIFLAPAALTQHGRNYRRIAEFCGVLTAVVLVDAIAFRWWSTGTAGLHTLPYLPLPVLLWASVRFGPFGLATALSIVALQWIPHARDGVGPFAGSSPMASIVALQVFLFVSGVPLMLLAAVGEERKRSESALQRSEERNRAMLAAIPDLMFLQAADGTYLDYHARDVGSLLIPPESFLGKRVEDVFPPELAARFSRAFAEATDEEPAVVEYVLPMHGEERTYTARVVRCDGDKRLSIVQDVTERSRADESLHRAQMELARMSRASALGELAATIAHEVDQPLCAVVANANACLRLLDGSADEIAVVREALTDIVTDGNRASEVIRRTRELFRQSPVERTAIDLNQVILGVLPLARPRIERSQVACTLRLAPDLPHVMGDRVQLQQVVFNLVTNAIDAMRDVEQPRRLSIETWRDGLQVCAAVSDTGAGFDARSAGRIFEPFFTTKPEGLGVGLALTRSIVAAHQGRLSAVPREGGGATFQVSLPSAEASHA